MKYAFKRRHEGRRVCIYWEEYKHMSAVHKHGTRWQVGKYSPFRIAFCTVERIVCREFPIARFFVVGFYHKNKTNKNERRLRFPTGANVLRVVRQQPAAVEPDTGLGQRFHAVRQLDELERLDVQVFRAPRLLGRSHFPAETPFQRQRPHRDEGLRRYVRYYESVRPSTAHAHTSRA